MENSYCEEERSMCLQNMEFNNLSMNQDNLQQRVSSIRRGPNQDASMRLVLHESRIEGLELEGECNTLES